MKEPKQVSVQEALKLVKSGKYSVHFRPDKLLAEEEQYAEVQKLEDIYEVYTW